MSTMRASARASGKSSTRPAASRTGGLGRGRGRTEAGPSPTTSTGSKAAGPAGSGSGRRAKRATTSLKRMARAALVARRERGGESAQRRRGGHSAAEDEDPEGPQAARVEQVPQGRSGGPV